ncbi:MAG: cytochrome P450 [Candidatus Binatia bacterium]
MPEYDPYAYEMHEDPYPTYAALRTEAPLYRNERLGFWALSRHVDVMAGFRDITKFSNRNGVSLDPASSHPRAHAMMSFLALDPPRHTRMRALVSRGFTPRRIAELEPRIREIANGHIDRFIASGRCDFIKDFAGKFPMDVISEMLGVPEADRDQLRAWADTVVHREEGMTDVPPAGMEAAMHMLGYFGQLVADHRAHPRDDLTAALLAAEIDGDRLDDGEILGFLFLMIIAGNETTTKLLGNAVYWLWRNPDQRRLVAQDPTLIPRWVEETLRYDGSTQALARTVVGDLDLYGQTMRDGDRVVLLVGSANRDERVFAEPDCYDILRDTNAMLSFGQGTHFCLGAALARLEARVALEEVQRRFPDYAIDEAGMARVHSVNVRGFAALPLTFTGARESGR